MGLYPILLNIKNKPVVVVGGGEVALRKVKDLIEADAVITLIAPEIHEEIQSLAGNDKNRISILMREYREGDLKNTALVFSATSDPEVNNRVFRESERLGIFINAVDDPANSSFIVPSFVKRGDFIMAVSTSGASPSMAARLRRSLQKNIPENIEEVLLALREVRSMLMEDSGFSTLNSKGRGDILKKLSGDDKLLNDLLQAKQNGKLKEFIEKIIR